eukprot:COSAG06_NODE_22089_length_734_cov_1.341732_1_plen_116_part_10
MASPSRGGGSDWEGLELNDGGESVPLDRHSEDDSRNRGGRGGSAAPEDDDASSASSDGGTPLRDLPGGAAAAARAGRSTTSSSSSGGGRLRGSPSPSPVARDSSMGNYGDAQVTQR